VRDVRSRNDAGDDVTRQNAALVLAVVVATLVIVTLFVNW
jgi:hypothetical protein